MSDVRRPVKRPRAARAPTERPSQILDAAARVLLRDGLSKATIEDIAAEAGLGKGTVYEYYGSKARIFTALRARYMEQTLAAGRAAAAGAPEVGSLERLHGFVAAMFAFGLDNGELVAVLFHEAGLEEPDELAPIRAALLELVREGVAAGQLAPAAEADFTVGFMLHGLHGVMEDSLARGTDRQRVLEQLKTLVTALLKPPGGRPSRRSR